MNDIPGFEILPNKVSPRIIDIKIKNETIEKEYNINVVEHEASKSEVTSNFF